MSSVWYIGGANERIIDSAEWTRVGNAGATTRWSKGNGWSIPQSSLSAGQIAFLDDLDEFVVTATDGPRPGAVVTPQTSAGVTSASVTEAIQAALYAPPDFATGANTAALLAKLKANQEDASILVIGDSTGNEATEWVRLMADTLGTRFPTHTVIYHLWDITGGAAYDTGAAGAAVTVQTGTGSRTLHIWNCSVSGATTSYTLGARWQAAVVAPNPDMVFINMGHNEGTVAGGVVANTWRARMLTLTESVASQHSLAAICLIIQNPRSDVVDQQLRARTYREVAAMRGYGVIDVQNAFLAQPSLAALLQGDFMHPNAAGTKVWSDEVARALVWSRDARPRAQGPSSISALARNLVLNGTFAAFTAALPDSWTAGSATASKDTRSGWFEAPHGWAVRIQASAAAQSFLSQDVPAGILALAKGRRVTVLARIKVASGQPVTAGRVQVSDSAANNSSTGHADLRDAWHWAVASIVVDPAATFLRVRLFADTGTSATADITVDSVHLVLGALPRQGI